MSFAIVTILDEDRNPVMSRDVELIHGRRAGESNQLMLPPTEFGPSPRDSRIVAAVVVRKGIAVSVPLRWAQTWRKGDSLTVSLDRVPEVEMVPA